jgi:hypothetical protein
MNREEKVNDILEQTKKIADAHRQFYEIYFKDNTMDFVFQWSLGMVRNGGGEIGEMFYIASKIEDFNPDSWTSQWPLMAEKIEKRARETEKKHKISSREFYFRASNYYRSALAIIKPSDPNFSLYKNKYKKCYMKAFSMFGFEYLEISFENTVLPGMFIKPANDNKKRKTFIAIGGGETFFTDLYFHIGPDVIKRDYNFITVDIPGQGFLPEEGHFFRHDTETPLKKVLDYVTQRDDVDNNNIAIYGISGGGYYVPRAAAYDKRIKACIANHFFNDFYKYLSYTALRTKEESEKISPTNYRMMELVAWRMGIKSVSEIIKKSKEFVFDPQNITCPFLNVTSEGEYTNPNIKKMQNECFNLVSSKNKKMIVAPFDEGAGAHCLAENGGLMSSLILDWLDEVFENTK